MEYAFVPLSILLKILSLFIRCLSEFWVKESIILASLQLLNYIVSFISNDNVDEAVNVKMSCGLYTALLCCSAITASSLKFLGMSYTYICVCGRDGGGEWGDLHNLTEPPNI